MLAEAGLKLLGKVRSKVPVSYGTIEDADDDNLKNELVLSYSTDIELNDVSSVKPFVLLSYLNLFAAVICEEEKVKHKYPVVLSAAFSDSLS